jgi:pimeloyl-ACP methyl ester carboxylesterase
MTTQIWLLLSAIILLIGLLAAGFFYERRSRRRDARRFPPPGWLIDVGGHRLHLLTKGTDGPTVVFEQGAGGPSLGWLGLQEQISKFARVCLYDRAGYQWSDEVRGPRNMQARVRDLHELLVRAALPEPYVLVGHSYGGFLVRLFARDYPESVAGLVLVDTPHEQGYLRREVLSLYSKLTWVFRGLKILSIFGVPRLFSRWLVKPEPGLPVEVCEQLAAMTVRREYFATAIDDVRSCTSDLLKSRPFGALGDLPLAVITHAKPFPGPFAVLETGWREGQERLAALSTNGVLIVAEKANHMIHMDEPEMIVDAIRTLVERARQPVP